MSTPYCDTADSAEKGVELSLGDWDSDGYWVPLVYYHRSFSRRPAIRIGEFSPSQQDPPGVSVRIRGYDVPAEIVRSSIIETLEICDSDYLRDGRIQFRWLETSYRLAKSPPVAQDVWTLDNVNITWMSGEYHQTLLWDDFKSQELK